MGIVVLMFYGWDNSAQVPWWGRYSSAQGLMVGIGVLRVYGGDSSAQVSMVGIIVLRFHGGDGTVVLRVYGGDRSAQGLWWG